MNSNRGTIPVSFFGIAVGALAFANLWRVAIRVWHLPTIAGDVLSVAALAVWVVVLLAYGHKWLTHAAEARAEMQHPVQSSFAALVPVSSLLAAQILQPYAHSVALALFGVAVVAQLVLGVYLHGRLWQGGRKPELITAAIYLPTVASSFVAGTAAAAFGFHQLGGLFFGAGVLSWLAIESMILHRAAVHEALPEALRPILGIQLAPPVVGGVTYLSLSSGTPDLIALMLLGYGLYQVLMLLRLLPWIRQQAFVPGYWAFSFGVAALPTMAIRMVERGATGPLEWIAPVLFIAANVVIGILVVKTLGLLVRGKLIPAAGAAQPVAQITADSRVARA
ncbi:dicarboxylate transporter/tellurite-resistance protein TehA [Paraburkholderia sp. SEWSISQ10-3 4]|uniref:dicarboxylate transporter/tellurite-resistance protein TehA n=1 Tax=Paraburkholderia TaxID=1822464 RepID=UPI002257C5C5|nr:MULTISPECIES: dicarboxylate transporter/tellurite-resistance protein TehA [Paraburkholderia]MCX4136690.1 dicarboxylate transporter/tellurite-resistance protein TehA [Paraburkholderia aspalathi]MDN7169382.1 dicarboxylate transporter/tellurite-resistance protein TehA [Paraburkholderia sp. SEWSISQ10-3 4]MDQ6499021.1 dicarboxylate transporter/tellurite-resistance protein TehA [Paraburkholderia aspalathi]